MTTPDTPPPDTLLPGTLSRSTVLRYALPGFALAIPTIPVYVFLPTYYAETVGLGLAATGGLMLAARIFDVVSDPLIGLVSDRFTTRWGRRKPWVVLGGIIAALALLALFHPPADATGAYLLIGTIALYTGWTMLAIPYFAWGAELSGDYDERSGVTGAREGAMLLGILFAGSIPAGAAAMGLPESTALSAIAWLAVLAGIPAIFILVKTVPEPPPRSVADGRLTWRGLALVMRNRPFVRLLGAWFVNGLANGLPSVLFPLYLAYGIAASELERGVLILLYFACAVFAIPLWLAAARRFGKHRVWCAAMAAACLAFVWVPLLDPGQVIAFGVICIVTGMALGADLALPPAMQADIVDLDTLRSGQERAGLFFALWSMATKFALAAAVGIGFPALAYFGFDMANPGNGQGLTALVVIYAWVPVVLKCGAIAMVWGHPMTARRQRIVRRRLEALAQRR